jgi:para-nitrobenzyl esterase
LGIFGFLGSSQLKTGKSDLFPNAEGSTGNFGAFDQAAAVMWVHENIHHFGGDNTRITVGGQSSGSCGVASLLASPQMPDGMISGAVMESGGFAQWASINMDASELLFQRALEAGKKKDKCSDLECFKKLKTSDLADISYSMEYGESPVCLTGDTWAQVVDGVFLKQHLGDLSRTGAKDVDVIYGSQKDDGADFFPAELHLGNVIFLTGNVNFLQWGELEKVNTCGFDDSEFSKLYSSEQKNSHHNARFMDATEFTTDQHYKCPAVRYVSESKKVFRYNMGVPLPMGIDYDITYGGAQGKDGLVRHSENLPFYWSELPEDSPQYAIGQGIKYYYANFIRFGDVNGEESDNKYPRWDADSNGQRYTMTISLGDKSFDSQPIAQDVLNRCQYWEDLFKSTGESFFTSCLPMSPRTRDNEVAKCPAKTVLI